MSFISVVPAEIHSVTPAKIHAHCLNLTVDAARDLGCEPGDNVTVRAGSAVTSAEITVSGKGNHVSPELLKTLGLPAVKELRIRQEAPGRLQIGPLIGIMISRGRKYKVPPYSSQRTLLKNFLKYSIHAKCLAYVFSPKGVDMINNRILGYFLDCAQDGAIFWNKHTFPLPDIVYDRVLYRTVEKRKITRQVTAYLAQQKIRYFNPKFLNKWETYRILSGNPALSAHLPVTRKFQGPMAFIEFLECYKTVYLKPVHGSLGKGIVRVSLLPEGYGYHYRKGKKSVCGVWQSPDQLADELSRFISGKPYIMQQGLDLLKYQSRVFDVRVLMQKDGQGSWVNSATVARVGMTGSIFPNVAAGGEPRDIDELWQEITGTPWSCSETRTLTDRICLAAAHTLEEYLGTFGEMGLDIGADTEGQVWIIEINSKPSRKVFPRERHDLKKNSIEMPVDFAAYLAGFPAGRK